MSSEMELQLILLLSITYFSDANIELRKCCPRELKLNDFYECVPRLEGEWQMNQEMFHGSMTSDVTLVPDELASNDSGLNIPCDYPYYEGLTWTNQNRKFSISAGDGELTSAIGVFNTSHFCVDAVDIYGTELAMALVCKCLTRTCVNVCCDVGGMVTFHEDNTASCVDAPEEFREWQVSSIYQEEEPEFLVVHEGYPQCAEDENLRVVKDAQNIHFAIHPNGSIYYKRRRRDQWLHPKKYCTAIIQGKDGISVNALYCGGALNNQDIYIHGIVYGTLLTVGAVFLLATLVVHALLPELRRAVRGLSLMAHCACMLVAHVALIIIKLAGAYMNDVPCIVTAYVAQFFFVAGIFWLNVLCIDISLSFRSMLSMVPSNSGIIKKFTYYCIYAMGVPFLLFIVTFCIDRNKNIPELLRPNFGDEFCWFDNNSAGIFLYFYGPIGLILMVNAGLFIFTTLKIVNFDRSFSSFNQSETQRHDRNSNRKKLFLKLSGLMGIPWVMEIVSWAVGGEDYYWYLTDAMNILRSIFIFVMFCCKQQVYDMLTRRYPRFKRVIPSWPRASAQSSNQENTQMTTKCNKSRTDSADKSTSG